MFLEVHSDNPFDTNCWLIAAEGSDEAVVVWWRVRYGRQPIEETAFVCGSDGGLVPACAKGICRADDRWLLGLSARKLTCASQL